MRPRRFVRPEQPAPEPQTRVNERIRVREVRVIDDTGQQLGIMPPQQGLALAFMAPEFQRR